MIRHRTGKLVVLVLAQFACVSLWFAGNGVMDDLIRDFDMDISALGHLTSAVQFGFIIGTLVFAVMAIADRVSPSIVFFVSALIAAGANLLVLIPDTQIEVVFISRFLTGFFLAGIYPVGMKIAADYFHKELGKALGFLVGALVLGTAFPHLLRSQMASMEWQNVMIATSALSVTGGIAVYFFIPDGPFRKKRTKLEKGFLADLFFEKNFRAASFGYFGHMWELYAFWAFVPVVIPVFIQSFTQQDTSLFSFFIIAIGSIGCIIGGWFANRVGSFKVAFMALAFSCLCGLLSPLVFTFHPVIIFMFFLFWGMMVIMDSPQFSTLVAQSVPAETRGSALTLVNCIGFSITIITIQLLNILSMEMSKEWLMFLLFPGPALGLWAMTSWKHVAARDDN